MAGKTIKAFVFGAAVGVAIGLLCAKQSGAETRQEIKEKLADFSEKKEEFIKQAREVIEEKKECINAKIEELKNSAYDG